MPIGLVRGHGATAIQAICATSSETARRAMSWSPRYLHALSLFLQANNVSDGCSAKRLFASNPGLIDLDTKRLLSMVFDDIPAVYPIFLDRLGRKLRPIQTYRKWALLLRKRKLAAWITQTRSILTDRKLEAICGLPEELLVRRWLNEVSSISDADVIKAAVQTIKRLCEETDEPDILRSLAHTGAALDDWVLGWLNRAVIASPPFSGTAILVPIKTPSEIRRVSREFQNCLEGYIKEAVNGEVAFYKWIGQPNAVVSIRRIGQLGWAVEEIKLRKNRDPSSQQMRQIREHCANLGVLSSVEALRRSANRMGLWALAA